MYTKEGLSVVILERGRKRRVRAVPGSSDVWEIVVRNLKQGWSAQLCLPSNIQS